MKKKIILCVSCIAIISITSAQQIKNDKSEKANQESQVRNIPPLPPVAPVPPVPPLPENLNDAPPPPPPPPPPVPAHPAEHKFEAPPSAPVPPVPESIRGDHSKNLTPVTKTIINNMGNEMQIFRKGRKDLIIVKRSGTTTKLKTETWFAKRKFYEKKFGQLPSSGSIFCS